jgi:hypothetical protein
VIQWAKRQNPAMVSVVERLSKSALNEHVASTGELPEVGVRLEPERQKFFIK